MRPSLLVPATGLLLALAACGGDAPTAAPAPSPATSTAPSAGAPDTAVDPALLEAANSRCTATVTAARAVPAPDTSDQQAVLAYSTTLLELSATAYEDFQDLPGADAPSFRSGFLAPYGEQLEVVRGLLDKARTGQRDADLAARASALKEKLNAYAGANGLTACVTP